MSTEETPTLACRNCGGTDIRAWYPEFVGQRIAILGVEDGIVQFDYTGDTRTADDGGDNDEYRCVSCDDAAATLEELVGLPAPPTTYRTQVFDSDGTLAIMRADGQDVAHLRFVDDQTASDDAAEATWRRLTDQEKQWIIDRVVEAIR